MCNVNKNPCDRDSVAMLYVVNAVYTAVIPTWLASPQVCMNNLLPVVLACHHYNSGPIMVCRPEIL
jgi:hypothetical protein